MTFFGKFLAVLNLGALCGFLYLAVVDFQMRQAWAYANFRWDLALDGFPVDEEEPDARNRLRHLNLNDALCEELVGGPKINTLEKFLDLRKEQLLDRVDKQKGSKSDKLVEILVTFAPTAADREQVLSLKTTSYPALDASGQLDVLTTLVRPEQDRKRLEAMKKERKAPRLEEELRALLDDRIKMLKELPLAPVKKDQLGKKQAIARALLGFLDVLPTDEEKKQQAVERSRPPEQRSDPAKDKTYKATLNALGLRQLTQSLESQGREVLTMATHSAASRQRERVNFAYEHQELINLLIERQHQLQDRKDLLATKIGQAQVQETHAKAQEDLRDEKKKELNDLRAETRAGRKDAKGQLVRDKRGFAIRPGLEHLEDEIARVYRLRLRLRDANRINQEMEAEIRKLESEKR